MLPPAARQGRWRSTKVEFRQRCAGRPVRDNGIVGHADRLVTDPVPDLHKVHFGEFGGELPTLGHTRPIRGGFVAAGGGYERARFNSVNSSHVKGRLRMFAALGIILLVGGAILTFAVDRQAESVDLAAIGWIMMAGGALSLLVALIQGAGWMSMRNRNDTAIHTERHVSSDGRHYVEESHTA